MSCRGPRLSACELASIAATVETVFDQTATLQRPTKADSGQGGMKTTGYTTVGSYACSVLPDRRPQETQEAGRAVSEVFFRVLLPLDTPVLRKDRLEISSHVYEVQGTDAGRSFATVLEATCRRMD